MFKKVTLLVPALVISALVTGCSSIKDGASEAIAVQSVPAGADVYVNGDRVGQTPTTLDLGRKATTAVRIEKEGYRTEEITIMPKDNDHADDIVKFGPLHDFGYYQDLTPNPVDVELVPNEIPRSRAADQYAEMSRLISQVDQQRENGEIDPVEHKYKIEKIIEFYTN